MAVNLNMSLTKNDNNYHNASSNVWAIYTKRVSAASYADDDNEEDRRQNSFSH